MLALAVIAAALAAGCASSAAAPFEPGFYSKPATTALSPPLAVVSVHRFRDERPGAAAVPTMVYKFMSISSQFGESSLARQLNEVRATEPVAVGVARAVLQGFRARGVPIEDATAAPFALGTGAGTARIAMSGRVVAFGVEVIRSSLYEYRSVSGCTLGLEAYEVASGRKILDKMYARQEQDSGRSLASAAPASRWPALSRVLAAVVDEALNDPELLQVLRVP